MPTSGAFEFKLSRKAIDGVIEDELGMLRGEWGWHVIPDLGFLAIYAMCPDCGLLMTLWRKLATDDRAHGHAIDAQGNVHPSVKHSYVELGIEKCGFHTQPTTLLDFIDKRKEKA